MTEAQNPATVLTADIEYSRGSFTLSATFTLRPGWTVLFGNSGAGKTTLLRILAGLITPDHGVLHQGNYVLLDTNKKVVVTPGKRGIGFVTQHAALFPHLTAKQNISFGLGHWPQAEREARTEELLQIFAIGPLAARKPNQLSGGERQRVALARALAPRPHLLLLDEPFNAIDAASRAAIIQKLRSNAPSVLYVSHDLGDAWQINADAILLDAGKITAQGKTRTILAPQREQILAQLSERPEQAQSASSAPSHAPWPNP